MNNPPQEWINLLEAHWRQIIYVISTYHPANNHSSFLDKSMLKSITQGVDMTPKPHVRALLSAIKNDYCAVVVILCDTWFGIPDEAMIPTVYYTLMCMLKEEGDDES